MSRCCPICGELVTNGGMELFSNHIPTGWTSNTPDEIYKMDLPYFVHSGNYCVGIKDSATLSQIVTDIVPKCCYEFSLFALTIIEPLGMKATVTFITPWGEVVGGTIYVNPYSICNYYYYYRIFTTPAPCCTTAIRIDISAIPYEEESSENIPIPRILQFMDAKSLHANNSIGQGIIVDDVSLALQ